jgi:uncharacterized protein (DUF58 family)
MEPSRKYCDPEVLRRISRLDLRARRVVEGFVSGLHRSPYHGFSVEFAEHREYVPGDDIRHVDWKVYGRADRYFIKQYEEETNLRAWMLVDCSESMRYSSRGMTKYEYGLTLAASLMVLLLRQQDAVGLALFDSEIRRLVPASARPAHLRAMLSVADAVKPDRKTDVGAIFHRFAEETKRRGLIVLVSDLFAPAEEILSGLEHLRYRRHEVIVFHVLDPQELDFRFGSNTMFKGLEDLGDLLAEPRALRKAYREAAGRFISTVRRGCNDLRIDYELLRTTDPLDIALSRYLSSRSRAGRF